MNLSNEPLPRRAFLRRLAAAAVAPKVAEVARVATPIIGGLVAATTSLLDARGARIASAHDHQECVVEGTPNPAINLCGPKQWGVDILVEGAYFKALTSDTNEPWKKEKGIWSPVTGGRRFELVLEGTSGSVHQMLAPEDGNGLAYEETPEGKVYKIAYRQEGIGWDRAKLINPRTGQREDLPIVRGQIKRYLETPAANGEKFKSVYDICIPICGVVGGEVWDKTIYILTGLNEAELKRRGIVQKQGMHVPESDDPAVLTLRS